jgi:hypothetical protein
MNNQKYNFLKLFLNIIKIITIYLLLFFGSYMVFSAITQFTNTFYIELYLYKPSYILQNMFPNLDSVSVYFYWTFIVFGVLFPLVELALFFGCKNILKKSPR